MSIETTINLFIEHFQNKDVTAISSLFSDNIVFENVPFGTYVQGKDAVIAEFIGFFSQISSIRWDINRKIIADNIVVIERKGHAIFNFRPDRETVIDMLCIFEVIDNKITLFKDYFDSKSIDKQLS